MAIRFLTTVCVFVLPMLATAADVQVEEIRLTQVPDAARMAASKVAPEFRWTTATKLSKQEGSIRLWYKLLGSQVLVPGRQRILSDGDVEETPAVLRWVQVRVTPEGEVIDVWLGIENSDVPAAVRAALQREMPGAEPVVSREVRFGTSTKVAFYRLLVEARNGNFTFNISPDGSKLERE